MNDVSQKKFDEKIIKIVCSPNFKLFTCIAESGRLFLLRKCLTVCWVRSENKERVYNCSFNPSSTLLALFCSVDQVHYLKIINVEDKKQIASRKIFEQALNSTWFNLKIRFENNFDDDLIKHTEDNMSTQTSENSIIKTTPNLLTVSYKECIILYLQGIIPLFKINNQARSLGVCSCNKTFIYMGENSSISCVHLHDQLEDIKDGLYILKLIYILRPLIRDINNWIDDYKRHFVKKPLNLLRFLKLHSNKKSLKQEFCMIYFLGIISPELTHKISKQSNLDMLNDANQIFEKRLNLYSEITKLQYLIEQCVSICELIKSCVISNVKLSGCYQLDSVLNVLYEFHSWSFRIAEIHYKSNSTNCWRIFITWLIHVHSFLIRSGDKSKFFDEPVFHSLSDLGDDLKIRKILLDFILNELEKTVSEGDKVFSYPVPDFESLKNKLDIFEDCIAEYFLLRTHIVYEIPIKYSLEYELSIVQNQNTNIFQTLNQEKNLVTSFMIESNNNYLSLKTCMISTPPSSILLYQCFSNDKAILIVESGNHVSVVVLNDILWTNLENASIREISNQDINTKVIRNSSSFTLFEYFKTDNSILGFDETNILTIYNI